MAITRRVNINTHAEEGYFISMTDMMVGMLFLFIIMLMFFALKFNEAAVEHIDTVKDLVGADDTRKDILTDIKRSMDLQGVSVKIDEENGILRLPESILFDRNKSVLSPQGQDALEKLAASLNRVLQCYTFLPGLDRPQECPASPHSVESIFIEGHTDSDGDDDLNWELSTSRSFHTYQAITSAQEILGRLQNRNRQPILSVAGYGKQRPISTNDTPEGKRQNRRIDLRFIMSPPKSRQVEDIAQKVEDSREILP